MLRIPNVNISITTQKNHSFTELRPRWFAPLFKGIWASRGLDPERGVTVTPLPYVEGVGAGQFSTFDSVENAEHQTISILTGGDNKRAESVMALFQRVYPQGLREEIRQILAEEQRAARARAQTHKEEVKAAADLLALGMTEAQALALQSRGVASRNELAAMLGTELDLLTISECGFTPDEIAALEQRFIQEDTPKVVAPKVTSKKAKKPDAVAETIDEHEDVTVPPTTNPLTTGV